MSWAGRFTYLIARNDNKRLDLYAMDLLWSIASRNLQGDVQRPSELWWMEKKDNRTAKQIIDDTINGLGGE